MATRKKVRKKSPSRSRLRTSDVNDGVIEEEFDAGDDEVGDILGTSSTGVVLDESGNVVGGPEASETTGFQHPIVAERFPDLVQLGAWSPENPATENLECQLAQDVLNQMGRDLAIQCQKLKDLADEHKNAKAVMSGREKELAAQIAALSSQVKDQLEYRQVQVIWIADPERCVARMFRLDTNEFVPGTERTLSAFEVESVRQTRLPLQ